MRNPKTTPPVSSTSSPSRTALPSIWPYVWLGVIGHFIWGSYPVFAKRAVQEVPKFSMLVLAWLMVIIAGLLVAHLRDGFSWREMWHTLTHTPTLWALAVFVVLRSVTNIIAIDLTRAVWVQLINLMAPFMVALLGAWVFDQATPRFTYGALMLGTVGSALVLVEDWTQISGNFTPRDILGLATAVISMLALATYFQLVRRSHLHHASRGMIMAQQGLAALPVFILLSWTSGENWGAWSSVSLGGLLAVLMVIFLVQVGGNLIQITALSGVSPALITNMMALRLISALALGWVILGERLNTPAQWLGFVLVILTVSLYLQLQRK